jgi:hypothetical protein
MNWKGIWKNQYGSIVEITDDADNQIAGSFRTALVDSGFHGKEIPILGVHHGDCISFAGGGKTAAGDAIVLTRVFIEMEKWRRCGLSLRMPR